MSAFDPKRTYLTLDLDHFEAAVLTRRSTPLRERAAAQRPTTRPLARCEEMIERFAEPVAAHVLQAATEQQAILGVLPTADRVEHQLWTVVAQR